MSDIAIAKALRHLEDAEVAIISWWQNIEGDDESVDAPFGPLLAAVLRSVSRAAGALDADHKSEVTP